jgi:hypothetical protein
MWGTPKVAIKIESGDHQRISLEINGLVASQAHVLFLPAVALFSQICFIRASVD